MGLTKGEEGEGSLLVWLRFVAVGSGGIGGGGLVVGLNNVFFSLFSLSFSLMTERRLEGGSKRFV